MLEWRTATAAAAGAATARALIEGSLRDPPARLVRINVRGRAVPAVLGWPLVAGFGAGLAVAGAAGDEGGRGFARELLASGVVAAGMAAAGAFDDLRGDETARGFGGHIGSLLRGRVTTGSVKLVAGAATGLGAGAITSSRRGALETAMLVSLGANLANLLDRAPGRAAKVSAVALIPLVGLGARSWRPAGGALLGALGVVLVPDLRERAMLGDAGANPLGGLIGLGAALGLPTRVRPAVVGALAALNLLSEWRSFSAIIERSPWLAAFDRLGRRA